MSGQAASEMQDWVGTKLLLRVLLLDAGYVALLLLVYTTTFAPGQISPSWWPAVGLAVGVLLRAPTRVWPVLVGSLFLTLLALGLAELPSARSLPPAVAIIWALDVALVPTLGAFLFLRVGFDPALTGVRDLLGFVLLAAAVPAALASLLVGLGWWLQPEPRPPMTPITWWAAEFLGILTVAPVLLTWVRSTTRDRGLRETGEAILLALALVLAVWAIAEAPTPRGQQLALAAASFPLLAWAALRFGAAGAAWTALFLTGAATWLALQGRGPFSLQAETLASRVLFVQAFLGFATFSGLLLGVTSTERRREMAERSRALDLLDAVLRSAPLGIAVLDRDLRFIRVNDYLARLNGISPEAHEEQPLRFLFPSLAGQVAPLVEQVLSSGEPILGHEATIAPPGEPERPRSWLMNWFPVRGQGGQVEGVAAALVDITERVETTRELTRLYREAEEAVRVRDDFLSAASHELKTPLTPVAVRLQALERQLQLGQPVDPASVTRLRQLLGRLQHRIEDLLDVEQLRSTRQERRFVEVELGGLLEEVVGRWRERYPGRLIDLRSGPGACLIRGDRAALARIFDTLLSNALKFSPSGGEVGLHASLDGSWVEVRVSDQGIGIHPEDQLRLFRRYFRGRNASLQAYGGLGIGLPIARELVEQHGGSIEVESAPAQGSVFVVRLPVERAGAAP